MVIYSLLFLALGRCELFPGANPGDVVPCTGVEKTCLNLFVDSTEDPRYLRCFHPLVMTRNGTCISETIILPMLSLINSYIVEQIHPVRFSLCFCGLVSSFVSLRRPLPSNPVRLARRRFVQMRRAFGSCGHGEDLQKPAGGREALGFAERPRRSNKKHSVSMSSWWTRGKTCWNRENFTTWRSFLTP